MSTNKQVFVISLGESNDKQEFKVNSGCYELPLFKPPVCKLADAESDVSTIFCIINHHFTSVFTSALLLCSVVVLQNN